MNKIEGIRYPISDSAEINLHRVVFGTVEWEVDTA